MVDCAVVIRSFCHTWSQYQSVASIDQIAIFGLRNRSRFTFRIRQYQDRSGDKSLIYERAQRRKVARGRGWPGAGRELLRHNVRLMGAAPDQPRHGSAEQAERRKKQQGQSAQGGLLDRLMSGPAAPKIP